MGFVRFKKRGSYVVSALLFLSIWFSIDGGLYQQISSANDTSTTTTIGVTISPGLSGSISHVGTGVMSGNVLYINTFAPQFILLSWIDTAFIVTGNIISEITGDLSILVPEVYTLSLTSGDGMKLVTALYFPPVETGFSTNTIQYFVDTTMPSVATTITGPKKRLKTSDALAFSWTPSTDLGVGIDHYEIQISTTPTFSTTMSFGTTLLSLTLAAQSISEGTRYRRRGAHDRLGHIAYGPSHELFIYDTGTPSTVGPTPPGLSHPDACPFGEDTSGNMFDGLCSPSIPPLLIHTPLSHQAADERPILEKWKEKMVKPNPQIYIFPAYPPPAIYTIYEYPPESITPITDIYETDEQREMVDEDISGDDQNASTKDADIPVRTPTTATPTFVTQGRAPERSPDLDDTTAPAEMVSGTASEHIGTASNGKSGTHTVVIEYGKTIHTDTDVGITASTTTSTLWIILVGLYIYLIWQFIQLYVKK